MLAEELKLPKDIDLKFYRLTSPPLNYLNTPLSGLYNPIDNKESESFGLNNKFRFFDISSNKCANIENLLGINTTFGRIYTDELLEGLLTLVNISDHEVMIKDLKISVKNDEKLDIKKKMKEEPIEIKLPNNLVTIQPNKGYTIKIKSQIKCATKNTIEVNFHTKSSAYDHQLFKQKQRNLIKDSTDNYIITGGSVEFFINKKLSFESYNPFKISEILFHNSEVNTCLIEIRIFNACSFLVTICDLFLTPKNKSEEKIKLIKNIDKITNIANDSKYLMVQAEEQINLLFKIDNPDLFYDEDKFVLNIYWMKDFDFLPKIFTFEFYNNLNTYNEYYKMTVTEKPEGDITINHNFKIVINLKSKNTKKKYIISLSQEPIKDNDKTNDREIEIIDIIEKKMELNAKTPSNNFILICKSDVLGNVYLPKLRFSLYEGDKNNPIENVYKELLSFNCIPNNQNNIIEK